MINLIPLHSQRKDSRKGKVCTQMLASGCTVNFANIHLFFLSIIDVGVQLSSMLVFDGGSLLFPSPWCYYWFNMYVVGTRHLYCYVFQLMLKSFLFFGSLFPFAGRTSFRATKRTTPELDIPMFG
jgi:hypothetical protein